MYDRKMMEVVELELRFRRLMDFEDILKDRAEIMLKHAAQYTLDSSLARDYGVTSITFEKWPEPFVTTFNLKLYISSQKANSRIERFRTIAYTMWILNYYLRVLMPEMSKTGCMLYDLDEDIIEYEYVITTFKECKND